MNERERKVNSIISKISSIFSRYWRVIRLRLKAVSLRCADGIDLLTIIIKINRCSVIIYQHSAWAGTVISKKMILKKRVCLMRKKCRILSALKICCQLQIHSWTKSSMCPMNQKIITQSSKPNCLWV